MRESLASAPVPPAESYTPGGKEIIILRFEVRELKHQILILCAHGGKTLINTCIYII